MDFFGTLASDCESISHSIYQREELRDVIQSNLHTADVIQQQTDLATMARTPDIFSAIASGAEAWAGRRF